MNISFDTDITCSEDAAALAAFLIVRFPGCLDGALDQLDKGLLQERIEPTVGVGPVVVPVSDEAREAAAAVFTGGEMNDPVAAFGAQTAHAYAQEAVASVAPAADAAPAPVSGEPGLDKEGLPWDARIHASTQAKNVDGTWRAKRGVNQLLLHQVRAELAAGAPAAAPPPPSAPEPAANTGPASSPSAPPPPPADAPPPPAPMSPAERTAAEAVAEGLISADDATPPATLFANALRRVTSLQTQGKLNVAQVKDVITGLGLTEVRELLARPDLIPAFNASIDALVAE